MSVEYLKKIIFQKHFEGDFLNLILKSKLDIHGDR